MNNSKLFDFSYMIQKSCFFLFMYSTSLSATTLTVTTTSDSGAGSLRNALEQASSGDSIIFSNGLNGSIQIDSALPILTQNLTISGNGNVEIDGQNLYQIFFIDTGTVAISNLSINNGLSLGGNGGNSFVGGGGGALGAGGGIFVNSTANVNLTNVSFSDNAAQGGNGGIQTPSLYDSSAGGAGGGGYNQGTGGSGGFNASFGSGGGGGGGFNSIGGTGLSGGGGGGGLSGYINGSDIDGTGANAGPNQFGGSGGDGAGGIGTGGSGGAATIAGGAGNPSTGGGGGGGGGAPNNSSNGGPGGIAGAIGGGGGGGGGVLAGTGGSGGDFGGGAGAGGSISNTPANGGTGGFAGGGGAGGGVQQSALTAGNGGSGGYGGGGGAGGKNAAGGTGGTGGGSGANNEGGGGGGAAQGGALFVRGGGQVTMDVAAFSGNSVTPGLGGTGGHIGSAGLASGTDIFLMQNSVLNLNTFPSQAFNIAGNGVINFTGTNLTLGSNISIQGTLVVQNGTVNLASSQPDCTIVLGTGATLTGNGTLNSLLNSGTVSPGNSIGIINLLGNYQQFPVGSLDIEITPSGQADQLVINGASSLDGTLVVIPENGTYLSGAVYEFMTVNNGLSGTFNLVEVLGNLSLDVQYFPTFIQLQVLANSVGLRIPAIGENPGVVRSYLEEITIVPDSDLYDVLVDLNNITDPIEFASALDQLQPALFGGLDWTNAFNLKLVNSSLLQHTHKPCVCSCICEDENDVMIWIDIAGDIAQQQKIGQLRGFHTNTGLVLGGLDYSWTSYLTTGIGAGASYTHLKWTGDRGHSNIKGTYVGLYIDYEDTFYWNASALYGNQHMSTTRKIDFTTIDRSARSSNQCNSVLGHLEIGLNTEWACWCIRPFISGDYIHLHDTAHSEHGADSLNLHVDRHNAEFASSDVGVEISQAIQLCSGTFIPKFKLSWLFMTPLTNGHFTANFEDIADTFDVVTTQKAMNLAVPEITLVYCVDNQLSFSASYEGIFGSARQDQNVRLTLDYAF